MVKNAIEENLPFGIILRQGEDVFKKGCKVKVIEVFKEYQNGEYDIMVRGLEPFSVIGTEMEGDTVIGQIRYSPLRIEENNNLLEELQNSYLKILLSFGINADLEIHMGKKISYEFLQAFQIPLTVKKDLISIESEDKRLSFINNLFIKILQSGVKPSKNYFPEA